MVSKTQFLLTSYLIENHLTKINSYTNFKMELVFRCKLVVKLTTFKKIGRLCHEKD